MGGGGGDEGGGVRKTSNLPNSFVFGCVKTGAHDPEPPSSILALGVNPVSLLVIFRNRGALEFPHIFKMPNQSEAMSDVTRR